jgi:MFS family permease
MMALIVAGIVLHGICYDFFFVTGQIYVDKRSPKEIRGQVQGFLVLVTQGLGMVIGQILMGVIVNSHTNAEKVTDWHSVWLLPCGFAAVIMVIFFALFRDDSRSAGETDSVTGADAPLELGRA